MKRQLITIITALFFGLTTIVTTGETVVYFLATLAPWLSDEEMKALGEERDSFILPLTDPADIEHARNLIRKNWGIIAPGYIDHSVGSKYIGAQIIPQSDGINCNYLAPGKPLWSWHVGGDVIFYEYLLAESSITDRQASPQILEKDPVGWVSMFGSKHAFLNSYSPAKEIVPPVRVQSVITHLRATPEAPTQPFLILSWPSLGDNYAYTVEWASSPYSQAWTPYPGRSWPITKASLLAETGGKSMLSQNEEQEQNDRLSLMAPVGYVNKFFRVKVQRTYVP